jgi:hypothetical protein
MRIRTLIISLLAVCAVFAVSAVGAASASAQCLKVAVAGTGHWENNKCTVAGGTKEYVEVEKVETQLKPGEWCAKVKAGEPSTYKDNKCTEPETSTGKYIKVMAACYPVAEKETGNFASSEKCEKNETTTKGAWVRISKLENEVSPAGSEIWCAKVATAKTGNYKDNKCTEKMAEGEYIKVLVSSDQWEVCEKGGTEGWSEHKCNAGKGTGEWSWKVLAAGKSYNTTSNIVAGTTEVLSVFGKSIKCTGETDKGTITGGTPGTDLTKPSTFTGCTTSLAGCLVHSPGQPNGTIVLAASGIPTKLEQRLVGEEEILVDNFEEDPTSHEFVTLQFEPEAGKTCTGFTETKVTGAVAAEVKNLSNAEVELDFPEPELPGNTLKAFGVAAKFTSRDELSLENGWALRAR